MEVIQHNKQITKGSVLVCIQDAAFGITINDCLKVKNTIDAYKVEFEKPAGKLYLDDADSWRLYLDDDDDSWRFRLAYKNEERLCKS